MFPFETCGQVGVDFGGHAQDQRRVLRVKAAGLVRKLQQALGLLSRGGVTGLAGLVGRGIGLAWHYPAHRRWLKVVSGRTTGQLLAHYPRIAYRHSTTYLYEGVCWGERLKMLQAHYRHMNEVFDPPTYADIIGSSGLTLWRSGAAGKPELAVVLGGPCRVSRHREGELGLCFLLNGIPIYNIAFSVVPTANLARDASRSPRALFIGQVQGGLDCRDHIREASKLCRENAPRDVLMSALAGLAQAWHIDLAIGVESARSLSRRSCSFNHDPFWEQYGGHRLASGHYALPLPFHEGALTASSAAHRRRTKRKRLYLSDVTEFVAGEIRRLRSNGSPQQSAAALPLSRSGVPAMTWQGCGHPQGRGVNTAHQNNRNVRRPIRVM